MGKEKTTKFFYNFVIFPIKNCIKIFIKKFINKLIQFFLFTKRKEVHVYNHYPTSHDIVI